MSWLLDADVLSQPAKRHGDPRVTAWIETAQDNCYTSAVVLAQLAYWIRSKDGQQRQALQAWLTRLIAALHGRILSFNASVAHVWAEQQRELERAGRRMPMYPTDRASPGEATISQRPISTSLIRTRRNGNPPWQGAIASRPPELAADHGRWQRYPGV